MVQAQKYDGWCQLKNHWYAVAKWNVRRKRETESFEFVSEAEAQEFSARYLWFIFARMCHTNFDRLLFVTLLLPQPALYVITVFPLPVPVAKASATQPSSYSQMNLDRVSHTFTKHFTWEISQFQIGNSISGKLQQRISKREKVMMKSQLNDR